MVKKRILKTIEDEALLKKGAHIVLGLSGGPDSVCLFHVLCQEADRQQWSLYPVHVNHKFRPGAAEEDQAYVEALCSEKGWPCESFVYDCNRIADEEKLTPEEAGRKVRYEAFSIRAQQLCQAGVAKEDIVIAVAQNADDQAETILFRILRGTGTDGLGGISYCRRDVSGFHIIRPLLDCSKAAILDYCREERLQPRIDHTNLDPVYTRNKIRLQLMPILEEYNGNIKDTMIRMGKSCASDSAYLWETAGSAFQGLCKRETPQYVLLDGDGLRKLHKSVRQRVIALALRKIGLTEDLTYAHFSQCEGIVFNDSPSAEIHLPKGYCLMNNYADIKICRKTDVVKKTSIRTRELTREEYDRQQMRGHSIAAFDGDLLKSAYGEDVLERIMIGCRQAGDTIAIGKDKRKKIQDYFVDRKIPRDQREQVMLVKIGHDVLWVTPYEGKGRFSSNFQLCADTKKVICVEIICDL